MGRARYGEDGEPLELNPDVDFRHPARRILPRYTYEEDAERAEIARRLEEEGEDDDE